MIEGIYPELDNLVLLKNPKTGMSYSFMKSRADLGLAEKAWMASEFRVYQILVVESGAAPLARLCQSGKARKLQLQWYSLKSPRYFTWGMESLFQYGLEYDAFPEDFKYGEKRQIGM